MVVVVVVVVVIATLLEFSSDLVDEGVLTVAASSAEHVSRLAHETRRVVRSARRLNRAFVTAVAARYTHARQP